MTERGRDRSGLPRRRLLSAVATGLVGSLAGCGYRPGGGDLAWESSLDTAGLLGSGRSWFAVTPDRLFVVRNQSGRTYDFETSTWGNVENASVTAVDATGTTRLDAETERQAVAPPAVTESSVFVPVEGGRVTAIDRDAAGFDPGTRGTTGGTESEETEADDDIRWQVDVVETDGDESGGGDESDESGEPGESNEPSESADPPEIDGVRASDRLVVAVAGTALIALDAETGDRLFAAGEPWPDGGNGAADRVAVDGDDVWAAVAATDSETGSDGSGTVVARFDPTGERRVASSLSAEVDWLAVADETIAVGEAGGRLVGYDRDLDRRFALPDVAPSSRPRAASADGGRFYYATGGTVRSVDAAAGELAWERSDLPTDGPLAVDPDGAYLVEDESDYGESGFGEDGDPRIVAVGADGDARWRAPLPEGVGVDELFAVDGRLIVVDDGELYGLHAEPGERWSLVG